MMTDPQRVRRNDPGNPEVCPAFAYHKVYSSADEVAQVAHGCMTAEIGCVDCKKILIKNVLARIEPYYHRRLELEQDMDQVRAIIADGNGRARAEASQTMKEVRAAIGLAANG